MTVIQAEYAADIMYIASLCFSKVAVIVFVKTIIKTISDKRILWVLMGAIAVWGVSAEFAAAFQCRLPHPWDYVHGRCFQKVGE